MPAACPTPRSMPSRRRSSIGTSNGIRSSGHISGFTTTITGCRAGLTTRNSRARPCQGVLASGRGDRPERPVHREARGPGEPPECLPNLDLRVGRDRHVAVDAPGRADDRGRAVPSFHAVLRSAAAAAREHHRTTRTLTRLPGGDERANPDRKSTRLNSSHGYISYAVFCLKKKKLED